MVWFRCAALGNVSLTSPSSAHLLCNRKTETQKQLLPKVVRIRHVVICSTYPAGYTVGTQEVQ